MSVYRRFLMIAKLLENSGGVIVLDFSNGVITLNFEGNGNKSTQIGTEVIING